MPIRWTLEQEREKYRELYELYTVRNLSISEVANILDISQAAVYDRLVRLKIKPEPYKKAGYLNKKDVKLPARSPELAEFVGILLGDGHISRTQIFITLGSKEKGYVDYVQGLFQKLFNLSSELLIRKEGYHDIYFGSVDVVRFFRDMGLVENKVLMQVGIPKWVYASDEYKQAVLRGLFDTDGSIYKIRSGNQISLRNMSRPLLVGARNMLLQLGFSPSRISNDSVYLTRKVDLAKFQKDIGFKNPPKAGRLKNTGV